MAKFSDWDLHHEVMRDVIELLCTSGMYILKGGTSLMEYYGLDRTSEDIDLDALQEAYIIKDRKFFDILEKYCEDNGYDFRKAKDTDTVSRVMIHYNPYSPADVLKIEASYRNIDYHQFGTTFTQMDDDVYVYTIDELAIAKSSTYNQRDKIRDLYDIAFIVNNYYDNLLLETQRTIYRTFEYETLDDIQVRFQSAEPDDLVDTDILLDMLITMGEILNIDFTPTINEQDILYFIDGYANYLDDSLAVAAEIMDSFGITEEDAYYYIDRYKEQNDIS